MSLLPSCHRVLLMSLLAATVAAPAAAAPGQAQLIGPSGDLSGSTIVYRWNPVSDATDYLFWIGTTTAVFHQQWFTAADAGCGLGTCAVILTLGVPPGPYNWFIQTWGPSGYGPWSAAKAVSLKEEVSSWSRKLTSATRFALVLDDQAILDNETGLTWERKPAAGLLNWVSAQFVCAVSSTAGRYGWRAPTQAELYSLADLTTGLPAAPFDLGTGITVVSFWTSTTSEPATHAYFVSFGTPNASALMNTFDIAHRAWCVRGATGA